MHKLNTLFGLALFLGLLLALTLVLPARSAAFSTYVVNTTNDVNDGSCNSTHCSLREAINAANSNAGADTITFNISGCSGGVCTLQPTSNLPTLTDSGTTIDATTSANFIEINGSSAGSDGIGLKITSFNNIIRGLVINRFASAGIEITGAGVTDNIIEGNKIGTDPSGTIDLGNGDGIRIKNNASNNLIGGSTTAQRNLISGNNVGVKINGGNLNSVSGNYIGVDASGALALGNTFQGILVQGDSDENVIGGDTTSQRNIISANEVGVEVSGSSARRNIIGANYIGVSANGTGDLGNALYGVALKDGAHHNTIGGNTGSPRNVISGNGSHGVFISGDGTDNNVVAGNLIGVDSTGSTALSNNGNGVIIRNQAELNTIGGDTSTERNVISGNSENGVEIYLDSQYNLVTGNYIGLNWSGTASLGNTLNGILISEGSHHNTIGGDRDLGLGNVISKNLENGIMITGAGTDSNTVAGNYIGLNPAGATWFGNHLSGIKIEGGARYNIIGGLPLDGFGNAISCNEDYGVFISGSATAQNEVRGNMIGLTADGSGVQGNGMHGVFINDAPNNVIGGANSFRNWISGNEGNGVTISGANASGNLVAGNTIGLDIHGLSSLGNEQRGVLIFNGAHHNTIGTEIGVGGRNVISGNAWSGVEIEGSATHHNTVASNYIGVDLSGEHDRGNGAHGVFVNAAVDNTIGGSTLGESNLISGNSLNGVYLYAAVGNIVSGNLIGTKLSGGSLPNDANGITLSGGAANNVIGGDSAGERNTISGNGGDGVSIFGSGTDNNTISGNYIGISANGISANANGEDGIWIGDQASGNLIGGDTTEERNVISANSWNGVAIASSADLNTVSGNYIGVGADGVTGRGNGRNGVLIEGALDNIIGGDVIGERNLISGNGQKGVAIRGSSASGNSVSGNFIGLDSSGALALGNSNGGIMIDAGANGNTIGGDTAGEGNVISGNLGGGVVINASGTVNNIISGNYIGTNASGASAAANLHDGVHILAGASRNTIGGDAPGERNVISGNSQNGILIDDSESTNNVVSGNYIGLNASGTNALPNGMNGVMLNSSATNNTIGGDTTGERNVISGNYDDGVHIGSLATSGNIVSANFIGTDAAGTAARPNLGYGVWIGDSASGNTIGGDTPGERNVISGNHLAGVFIQSGANLNTVSGNYVGVTPAGNAALGNSAGGIKIMDANDNLIGGRAAGQGNVISGNSSNGVWITGSAATGNTLAGNLIGLSSSGSAVIPNGGNGVVINNGAHGNTIGGSLVVDANFISGNTLAGIYISGVNSTTIQNNCIGTDNKCAASAGNGSHGISITGSATLNTVGPSNLIAYNVGNGVHISQSTTKQNRVTQNSIFSNAMGIDLVDGANENIPAPVIQRITTGLGNVVISGTACAGCLVEVFSNPNGDGEGKTYLGAATATGGLFSLTISTLSAPVLTATAYDPRRGTSEFSGTFFVPGKNIFLPLISAGTEKPKEGAQAQSCLPSTLHGYGATSNLAISPPNKRSALHPTRSTTFSLSALTG
jgi:CSLREA domain-containing protein